MASSASNPTPTSFYNLVGKPVVEKYGRFKGKVVSYKVSPDGELEKIFISNNGFIIYKTPSSIEINGKVVQIVPPPLKKASELIDELQYIYLQLKTLNNIFSLDSRWTYIEKYFRMFRNRFENALKEVSKILKSLENRRRYVNSLITEYREGLFTLQMDLEAGRIDSNLYKICYKELSEELLRLSNELEDVENMISEISASSNSISEIIKSLEERLREVESYEAEKI